MRDALNKLLLVVPAQAGLHRQDAEANIRAANGPQGKRQESHVVQFCPWSTKPKSTTGPRPALRW